MRGINVRTFESYLESDSLLADYYNEFLQLPCFSRKLHHDPVTQQLSETLRPPPEPVKPPAAVPSRANTVGTRQGEATPGATQQPHRPTPTTTVTETEDVVLESRTSKRVGADSNEQQMEIARLQDSVLRDWCLKHRVPLFLKSRQFREYKLCRRLQRRVTSRMSPSTATKSTVSTVATTSPEKLPTGAPSAAGFESILNRRSAPTCLCERRISFGIPSPMKPSRKFSREERPTSLPSVDGGRSIIPHLRKQVSLPSIPMAVDDEAQTLAREPLVESPREQEDPETEEDLVDFEFFMGRKSILEFKEEIINFQYEDGISEVEFDEDYISTYQGMSEFKTFLFEQPHERDILRLWYRIERYKDYLKEAKHIERELEKSNRLIEPMNPFGAADRTLEHTDTPDAGGGLDVIKEELTPGRGRDDDSVRKAEGTGVLKPRTNILDAYLTEVTLLERLSLKQMRVQLLRTIQQLFNRQLTAEAWSTLRRSAHDAEATNEFIRHVQFDILTRLHGYWLQRFLLHCRKACGNLPLVEARPGTSLTFYPLMRFERYLPLPGDAVTNALRRSVTSEGDDVVTEGLGELTLEESIQKTQEKSAIVSAFSSEVDAGCPFLTWLTSDWNSDRFEHERNLFRMWLEVDTLKKRVKNSHDRLLNVGSAWKIYQRYFNQDNYSLTSSTEKEIMYDKLTKYTDFTRDCALDLFGDAQKRALEELDSCWSQYCADDNEDIVTKAYERMLQEEQEKLHGSPNTDRRVSRKQSKRISRQGKTLSRVSRSAYSRALTGSPKKAAADDDASTVASFDSDAPDEEVREQFLDHVDDPNLMNQFSLYIQRNEGRDALNQLNLFLEIDAYFLLSEQASIVKEATAKGIHRTYFDEESRKHVDLPKHVIDENLDDRPSSRFFQEVQHHVIPDLNDIYQDFEAERQEHIKAEEAKKILDQLEFKAEEAVKLKKKTKEEGKKKKKQPKPLSVIEEQPNKKPELDRRVSVMKPTAGQKKKKVFGQTGGVSMVTREDRHDFFNVTSLSHEPNSKAKIEKFRKYLMHMHEGEGISGLEKDLQFYVEVVRFKDLHNSLDEDDIDRKVEVIVDVFLDSASPPWLQIDVPAEVASAIVQKASQYYAPVKRARMNPEQLKQFEEKRGEARDSTLFDEAQAHVMKDLLPYWAGFLKATALKNGKERKITTAKVEKQHRIRYEHFKKMEVMELPVFIRSPSAQPQTALLPPQAKAATAVSVETKSEETAVEEVVEPRTQLHFSISEGHIWKEPTTKGESKKHRRKKSQGLEEKASQTIIIPTAITVN